MSAVVQVRAFAKINLGLKVLSRRPDGYHEIRTIYQTVGLADRMEVSLRPRKASVEFECNDPRAPAGRENLVHLAAERWKRVRRFKGGIHISLKKKIPIGAGLAGGSSDAASAILALERLTGDRMNLAARLELAASLGSDVPFFFLGGQALGCGRGEEVYPLPDLPSHPCLIAFPGFNVSTAAAYHQLSLRLTRRRGYPRIIPFGARSLFPRQGWGPAENDFEQVVFAKWPGLARLKRRLIQAGAEIASLTGSGSAIYAVFDSAEQLSRARSFVPEGWQVFRTRTLSRAEWRRRLFVD